jgi:glycogen(starch) synthase
MIVYFNSQQSLDAARRAGVPLREAQIVYPGIDTDLFAYEPRSGLSNPLRLLMPGRIVPIKGVHDGIAALARLRRLLPEVAVYLDIVGPATDPAYLEDLRTQIRSYQLSDKVAFRHQLTATEMAVLYRFSDICLFLSHQPFGLSRIPLEAMASGSVVIATGNEGSSELLSNGQTGFLVPSGDPLAVADTVATLYDRPEQFVRVSAQARREVEEKYSIEQTVLHIEQILEQAALTRSSRA